MHVAPSQSLTELECWQPRKRSLQVLICKAQVRLRRRENGRFAQICKPQHTEAVMMTSLFCLLVIVCFSKSRAIKAKTRPRVSFSSTSTVKNTLHDLNLVTGTTNTPVTQLHIQFKMAYQKLGALHRLPVQRSTRFFSISSIYSNLMGEKPKSNFPDPSENSSAAPNHKVRSETQNNDQQSSASREEHKTGDDHPAKQPDYQAQPTRSTGIGGDTEVKGGKKGLGDRGDKQ